MKDELESAYSLSFSLTGSQVFAGYRSRIRLFDFERGGRHIQEIRTFGPFNFNKFDVIALFSSTKSYFSEKHFSSYQKGIISAIAMCPTFDGAYAISTYNGSSELLEL